MNIENESQITNGIDLLNIIEDIKANFYKTIDDDFNTCNQIALLEVALDLADNVDDFIELFVDVIENNCVDRDCEGEIDSIVNLCLTGK